MKWLKVKFQINEEANGSNDQILLTCYALYIELHDQKCRLCLCIKNCPLICCKWPCQLLTMSYQESRIISDEIYLHRA